MREWEVLTRERFARNRRARRRVAWRRRALAGLRELDRALGAMLDDPVCSRWMYASGLLALVFAMLALLSATACGSWFC